MSRFRRTRPPPIQKAGRTRRRPKSRPRARRSCPGASWAGNSSDGRLDRRHRRAIPGRELLRTGRLLRQGRSRSSRRQRLGRQGRRRARPVRPGRSGRLYPNPRGPGSGRAAARAPRQGRGDRPPSGPRPHPVGAQIRLPRRAGRRRRPRRGGPRPGGGANARLGRGTRCRDPDEASRRRSHDPRRGPEGGDRHLHPRDLAQSRPAAPHPRGDRQHGAGRRRQMAHHGQREAVFLEDADRRALPGRARAGADLARLRHRKGPCRRAVRDRGRFPRNHRRLFHSPRGDRGGDGRARPGDAGGEPARRPARGADDPGGEARRRPCRTAGDVAAPGGRARVRRQGARGRCGREEPGRSGKGSRGWQERCI